MSWLLAAECQILAQFTPKASIRCVNLCSPTSWKRRLLKINWAIPPGFWARHSWESKRRENKAGKSLPRARVLLYCKRFAIRKCHKSSLAAAFTHGHGRIVARNVVAVDGAGGISATARMAARRHHSRQ